MFITALTARLFFLCLLLVLPFGPISGQVSPQTEERPTPVWYCDKRLKDGRAIFVGSVTKIAPAKNLSWKKKIKFQQLKNYRIENLVRFYIEKTYKRTNKGLKELEILVPNLSTRDTPAKNFKLGEKYLLYLEALTILKDDIDSYYVLPNSQTKLLSESADTVAFLEKVYELSFVKEVLGYEAKDVPIGGIVGGRAVMLPKPRYPEEAKKEKASESISVLVLVDEHGQVIRAKAMCAKNLSLGAAAETAALNAKFSPRLVSGKPIKVSGNIVYNFVP